MTPNHFVVSFGLATDSLAEVYLRQTHGPTDALNGARIDVRGPFCSIAKTLKTNTSFERFQEREVWRARIVDPCFWSPDYPAFYRIRIQVAEQTTELICGLRRFGAKHGQLWLEGKRWVLRAAHQSHVPNATLQEWRAARLTMLAEDSPQTLLESAAKEGVMLVVDLDRQDWSDRLRKAASWPAVAIAVVPASTSLQECRRQAPNVLIAKRFTPETPVADFEHADVILCDFNGINVVSQLSRMTKPVVAYRRAEGLQDLASARASCELLQRDLAPEFDLSGYLV